MGSRQRVACAGSSRTNGVYGESARDVTTRLQHELMQSRAETQRVSEQLSCMMLLVKRAWQGDHKAAVDVANIVGVAPPEFEETSNGGFSILTTTPKGTEANHISVTMKPKSRALNNWALLTIRVLNREYKAAEERQEARQQYYIHQRQAYLDEQLLVHRDAQARVRAQLSREAQQAEHDRARQVQQSVATNQRNVYDMIARSHALQQQQQLQQLHGGGGGGGGQEGHGLLRRSNSYSEGVNRRAKSASHAERGSGHAFLTQPSSNQLGPLNRPQSGPRGRAGLAARPSVKHANQQANQLKWADLMIDSTNNAVPTLNGTHNGTDVFKMADTEQQAPARGHFRQRRVSYDDPDRYNVEGLFDAENALGPGHAAFRQRPVSAKAQQQSDSARARPRSAVVQKGERSLKYEVVRPASAVHSRLNGSAKSQRPGASQPGASTAARPGSGVTRAARPPSGKRGSAAMHVQAERQHLNTPEPSSGSAAQHTAQSNKNATANGRAAHTQHSSSHSANYSNANYTRVPPTHGEGRHVHVSIDSETSAVHSDPDQPQRTGSADGDDYDEGDAWDSEDERSRRQFEVVAFAKLGINLKEVEAAERAPVMKVDIRKPQSMLDYERDVEDMHSMEREIRRNAQALQKKLGISEQGMI